MSDLLSFPLGFKNVPRTIKSHQIWGSIPLILNGKDTVLSFQDENRAHVIACARASTQHACKKKSLVQIGFIYVISRVKLNIV